MISRAELDIMKQGSYLINASRGTVVDIPALIDARRSGKIAGFALDVYPNEPAKNGQFFENDLNDWALSLRSLTNIIITPHIGGSTEEAQSMIGVEVADALLKCMVPQGGSGGLGLIGRYQSRKFDWSCEFPGSLTAKSYYR
jgi:D-3-phosphoglycerate dehydrogenase